MNDNKEIHHKKENKVILKMNRKREVRNNGTE